MVENCKLYSQSSLIFTVSRIYLIKQHPSEIHCCHNFHLENFKELIKVI